MSSSARFSVRSSDSTCPMTVANMTFMLERLAQDCAPLQFVRELTQNAIDSIKASGLPGEIRWDVDWFRFDLEPKEGYKLALIDNGIGMTGPQVLRKVELPAAVPLLMTGVRVSAVQIIATATLGALVGYECLGTYIVAGLARGPSGRPQVLAGAMLVAGLALTVDVMLNSLERVFTPWRRGRSVVLP